MNAVIDRERELCLQPSCQPAERSHQANVSRDAWLLMDQSQVVELASYAQEYAMSLDEVHEGLLAVQRVLQNLQVSTVLASVGRQPVEQAADTCSALIASVEEQLVTVSDELHAVLRHWAKQARHGAL